MSESEDLLTCRVGQGRGHRRAALVGGRRPTVSNCNPTMGRRLLRMLVPPYILFVLMVATTPAFAQRQMEHLGRGVVAIHEGEGNAFLSWRLLGNEPEATAFNVYR
jgi:rhamnogalacturonan endolyase